MKVEDNVVIDSFRSGNWFRFTRQIESKSNCLSFCCCCYFLFMIIYVILELFDAPMLKEVNFSGCPGSLHELPYLYAYSVCKVPNYREFVIYNCPQLEILDNRYWMLSKATNH